MGASADEVLERELEKLGRLGGSVGAGLVGAAGGGLGAKWAARRLSSSSVEQSLEVAMSGRDALTLGYRTLSSIGQVLPGEVDTGKPAIRALVGSGILGMNPAVVDLSLEIVSEQVVKLTIRATAKEGLIKQHTAEKAIRRVIETAGWPRD